MGGELEEKVRQPVGTCGISGSGALGIWRRWVPEHPLKRFRTLPVPVSYIEYILHSLPVSGSLPPRRSSLWVICRSHASQHVQRGLWGLAGRPLVPGNERGSSCVLECCVCSSGWEVRLEAKAAAKKACAGPPGMRAGSGLGSVWVGSLHLAPEQAPLRCTAASFTLCPSRGTGLGEDSARSGQLIATAPPGQPPVYWKNKGRGGSFIFIIFLIGNDENESNRFWAVAKLHY